MNFRTTIVLIVILVVIGAIWMFAPSKKDGTGETPPVGPSLDSTAPVFEEAPEFDQLTRVELARQGESKLVFERAPGETDQAGQATWQLVEPVTAPVETYTVRGLAATIGNLKSRGAFEPGANGQPTLAEAGLEPPRAVVTLVDEAGKARVLEIGEPVVMSNDTYVRVAGQTEVQRASQDLQPQLRKKVDEYRSKRLVDTKVADAKTLRIKQGGTDCAFSRDGDDWIIDAPVHAYADRVKVNQIVTRLNQLRADEFVDDAPTSLGPYGLDEPYLTVAVMTETEREVPRSDEDERGDEAETQPAEPQFETVTATQTLLVGDYVGLKTDRRYAKLADRDWVVAVADSNVQGLIPNLKDLRDANVTRVKAADVTSLKLVTGGVTSKLEKVDGRWRGTGDLAELEVAAVNDLLEAFEDLRAIDYVESPGDLAEYGLDAPRAVLTVTAAGAVEPVVLRVGSKTGSGLNAYVQRGDDPTVIVVRAPQADRLAVEPTALRSREIFSFKPEQLQRIIVERPAMHYELVRDGAQWKLAQPDAPIDRGSTRALVNDLSRLRGRTVAGKVEDADYGFDNQATSTTIRIELADEPPATSQPEGPPQPKLVEHVLRVSRKDGVSYAHKDDDACVFELDETVFRVLTAELIDPRLFSFKPEDMVAVKIVSTGGTLELVKRDGAWKYAPDPFVELSQKSVEDFVKEIAEFRAEAYFAYRDGDLEAEKLAEPQASLTITLADGSQIVVHMTQEWPGELPRKAALVGEGRIFRMREADCEKLLRGLDAYLPAETGEAAPTP